MPKFGFYFLCSLSVLLCLPSLCPEVHTHTPLAPMFTVIKHLRRLAAAF